MKSYIVNTIPQNIDPPVHITLKEFLDALPKTIPFKENIGINGRLRFGKQYGPIGLTIQSDENKPSKEMFEFFSNVAKTLPGNRIITLSTDWRKKQTNPLWLYSNGEMIVHLEGDIIVQDKPMQMTQLPCWLPASKVVERLKEITDWKFPFDCYLTGGLVRENGSYKDADFIIGTVSLNDDGNVVVDTFPTQEQIVNIRLFLEDRLQLSLDPNAPYLFDRMGVDVGAVIMQNKGDVYLCKVFERGTRTYVGP